MSAGKAAVLGAGAWGSAIACIAARTGFDTTLWGRSQKTVDEINLTHKNSAYLQNLSLDERVTATHDLNEAVRDRDLIFLAVPTQKLEDLLSEIASAVGKTKLISTCKGINQTTGKLPHQTLMKRFSDHEIYTLSGPSFATDVVAGKPTAVTVAGQTMRGAKWVCDQVSNETFRCYASDDLAGVELGGALKNVLALAVGCARGMNLGASAEAALISRGFAELRGLATALGAKRETLTGLSGLGDLILTCSSDQSRNFRYGQAMGKGETLDNLPLAEGAFTAKIALKLAQENSIETPIIDAVVNVLEKSITAREAVEKLLTRPLKSEH